MKAMPILRLAFTLALLAALEAPAAAGVAPLDAPLPGSNLPDLLPSALPVEAPLPSPPVMPGWPQTMGTVVPYSPVGVVLADIEGDGDLEVIAGSTDSKLYLWDHDGVLRAGWPVTMPGQVQSKAAVADLDGDGVLEILVAVKNGQLHILHADGTSLAGWPQTSGVTFGFLSPSVYDLDADGTPEVMLGGGSTLRVWNADGTLRSGWPQTVAGTISGTLAIGDVVGDATPEIFAVSTSKNLYGFAADGTALSGFPIFFNLSNSYAAPSIGDLDGNGTREVCVVGYNFGVSSSIFAYEGDGSAVPGFPVSTPSSQTYSCPVLGDMDGDGDLELFNAGKVTGNTLFAWDHTGALLPGWPQLGDPNMEGSVILADFDGAGPLEMAVADNNGPGVIFGHNLDGTVAAEFPIAKPGFSGPNSPALGDVDGDGDLDMAMTTADGSVTLWDFAAPWDADKVEWGTLFHDDWNTNQHGFVVPGGDLTAVDDSPVAAFALVGAHPNPLSAGGVSTLTFTLRRSASLRLSVHDATGRRVRVLAEGLRGPGEHVARWDGHDDAGKSCPAGVYLLSLETADGARRTAKLTVLR